MRAAFWHDQNWYKPPVSEHVLEAVCRQEADVVMKPFPPVRDAMADGQSWCEASDGSAQLTTKRRNDRPPLRNDLSVGAIRSSEGDKQVIADLENGCVYWKQTNGRQLGVLPWGRDNVSTVGRLVTSNETALNSMKTPDRLVFLVITVGLGVECKKTAGSELLTSRKHKSSMWPH